MSIITAPGVYPDIPNEIYHGRDEICPGPSISSSGLKTILAKSPYHYWYGSGLNPNPPVEEKAPSTALNFGKLAHSWVVEGDKALDDYEIVDDTWDRRAKDRKAWAEEVEAAGKTIMKQGALDQVRAMARAINTSIAAPMLRGSEKEVTLAWQDEETGVWLRVRFDALHLNPPTTGKWIVPDYKTAADAGPVAFSRAVANFGYHISAAMYLEGCERVLGRRPDAWVWMVQESAEPFAVACYQADPEDLEWGRLEFRRALNLFAECLRTDHWPGYAEDVAMISTPAWHRSQLQKAHDGGAYAGCYPDTPPPADGGGDDFNPLAA